MAAAQGRMAEEVPQVSDSVLGQAAKGLTAEMRLNALWWWIDRWRKSTAYMDMTLEEQGAYRNLLDEAHLRGGALPDDQRILARACGDPLRWEAVKKTVLARFLLKPDGWHHETLDSVMAESQRRAEKQKTYYERTKAGNNAGNNPGNNAGNTDQSPVPVPVKVKVQSPDNELNGSALAVRSRPWNQLACEVVLKRYGGTAPGGRITKALAPLERKYGAEAVLASFVRYVDETEPEYFSPEKFATTYTHWSGAPRLTAREAKRREVLDVSIRAGLKGGGSGDGGIVGARDGEATRERVRGLADRPGRSGAS